MQDLKNITERKRLVSLSSFFRKKRKTRNSFKALAETKKDRKRLKVLLPVLCGILALYPLSFLVKSALSGFSLSRGQGAGNANAASQAPVTYRSFRLAADALKNAQVSGDRLVAPLPDGGSLSYTISTALQNRVERVMAENAVPFGVFVAIEPKTGKVLALTGYSSVLPGWGADAFYKVYPMASLFKMVTACAALEMKKVEPDTMFAFRGSSYSENPRYWSVNPKKAGQQMPLDLAMGKSINPVFGRLASDVVGRESLISYARRFGFNQTLFPGTPVVPSRAALPKDDLELKLMGCGLGREVKISPFHAAVVMAALANKGTMLAPILTEEIRDGGNRVLPAEKTQIIGHLVTTETADKLSRMLLTTVTDGTSRRAFHDRHGRSKLPSVTICAKTGSINGTDPEGRYTWFAAYAPAEDPQIALVALVINQNRWKIKASRLGAEALEEFFANKSPDLQTLLQD
jgi:cell division protein FtsI/penicillin-binding protein 2